MPSNSPDDDNFGYPRSLVIASANPDVLLEHKNAGRSLVWRPGIDPAIPAYTEALRKRDPDRMNSLDDLRFHVRIMPDDQIVVWPYIEDLPRVLHIPGMKQETFDLPTIFPGDDGKPLIRLIEKCLRETVRPFFGGAHEFLMLSRTITKDWFEIFHVDPEPVIGLPLTKYPTQFGPWNMFRPNRRYAGDLHYSIIDFANIPSLPTLEPGDVSYIIHPHRVHGTKPYGQPKLWLGFYGPSS